MRAALLSLLFVLGTVHAVPTSHSSTPTLLFTNAPPSGCLAESYYGTYGGRADQHIYIPTASCLDQPDLLSKASWGGMGPLFPLKDSRLVWVGQAGVENAPNDLMEDWMMIKRAVLQRSTRPDDSTHQRVFDGVSIDGVGGTDEIRIVHASGGSIIMQISEQLLPVIDTFLPPHLVPVVIPREPYPVENGLTGWNPVPKRYADHLANITSRLKFDPKLDSVLTQISHDELRRNIRYLTGEAPSGITSRHSFTPGAIKAAHWLQEQAEKTGAECHLEHFLPGFSPNVICTYPSKTNSTDKVILSAHYDSRGSWGSVIAPGGDDDGSGSGHLLSIAQTIGRSGVSFDQTVVLAFFAGEEQGLLGSHAYAEKLYKNNETVLYHVQADMLAYHVPGEPLQLGLPQSIHLAEASYLLGNLSHIYAPELLVGKTAACCSDHQSFLSFGFPASAVFERNGPIADPKYHHSGDVSSREGYDFEQVVSIAKVTLAAILTVGGWSRE